MAAASSAPATPSLRCRSARLPAIRTVWTRKSTTQALNASACASTTALSGGASNQALR